MGSSFPESPISELCERVTSGSTPLRSRADFFAGGTIDWFKTGELNDWFVESSIEKVTETALSQTANQACAAMVVDRRLCDPRFFFYALKSQRHKLVGLALGGAQRNLSAKIIKEFPLPAPPLNTQRRIASILSAYDDLIENCQRRIRILEDMARSLYREWFVYFRFPGADALPGVDSPIGPIPQGWEVKRLEALMLDHIGGGWGKEAEDDNHTEPAWVVRGTDIPSARFAQVDGVPHRFHTLSNIRSRRLRPGDVIFEVSGGSKGQPVGRTLFMTRELHKAFKGDDVICASFCKRVRPDAAQYGAELLYLSFVEGYESGEIEQYQVQSTGISNFKWTEYIRQTLRPVPPQDLRARFVEGVGPMLAQIAQLGLKIANLRRTRDLLLPRLLSGQIDIPSAEPVLSAELPA